MNLKTGDIIVSWGNGWHGKLVRYLERAITGMKYPPSHISIAIDENKILSTESNGIKIIPKKQIKNNSEKYVIYRYKKITEEKKQLLQQIIKKYINKGYDYSLYFVWFLNIVFTILPFFKFIFFMLEEWLKEKMKKTYECSELITTVWQELGYTFGVKKPQYTTPIDVYQLLSGCNDYELIKTYNGKTKKSNIFNIIIFILSLISLLIFLRLINII